MIYPNRLLLGSKLPRILAAIGGMVMSGDGIIQNEKVLTSIEGDKGIINIINPIREPKEDDQDLHSLIANILLKREKRLTSGT